MCQLAQKSSTTKQGKSKSWIQSVSAFAQPVPDGVSRKVWEMVNAMHQDEVSKLHQKEEHFKVWRTFVCEAWT